MPIQSSPLWAALQYFHMVRHKERCCMKVLALPREQNTLSEQMSSTTLMLLLEYDTL